MIKKLDESACSARGGRDCPSGKWCCLNQLYNKTECVDCPHTGPRGTCLASASKTCRIHSDKTGIPYIPWNLMTSKDKLELLNVKNRAEIKVNTELDKQHNHDAIVNEIRGNPQAPRSREEPLPAANQPSAAQVSPPESMPAIPARSASADTAEAQKPRQPSSWRKDSPPKIPDNPACSKATCNEKSLAQQSKLASFCFNPSKNSCRIPSKPLQCTRPGEVECPL